MKTWVKKVWLANKVADNMNAHVAEYEKARAAWRERVLAALEAELEKVRAGASPTLYFALPEPVSHEREYARVLDMLTQCTTENLEIDERDYARYVLDEWEWQEQFKTLSATYLGS